MDITTITAAISAVGAGVGLIDKMTDQVEHLLTKASPEIPKQHRQKIESNGSELTVRRHGEIVQRITAKDLEKLPPDLLRHISVYEKSMENHYALWAAVYPQRNASVDPIVNAKVDQQLKQMVSVMSDDINGILSFLESSGIRLDDHYMHIRHLVGQTKYDTY